MDAASPLQVNSPIGNAKPSGALNLEDPSKSKQQKDSKSTGEKKKEPKDDKPADPFADFDVSTLPPAPILPPQKQQPAQQQPIPWAQPDSPTSPRPQSQPPPQQHSPSEQRSAQGQSSAAVTPKQATQGASSGSGSHGWSSIREDVRGGMSTPGTSQGKLTGTPATPAERARWRQKLQTYFSLVAPHKIKDIEACLDHYDGKRGGFDAMWTSAQKRFGPAPTGDQYVVRAERQRWREKLKSYYTLVDPSKTDEDVEECLSHFEAKPGGYDKMWKQVQQRYGVVIDPSSVATTTANRKVSPGRKVNPLAPKQSQAAQAVPMPVIEAKVSVMVVVGGISPKLYRIAGPAKQYRFNAAVAQEVKVITNLPNPLTVINVSESVDSVVVEMDTALPHGWSAANIGSDLIQKVMAGNCSVVNIRRAYLEQLEGNPQRVFIIDAAVAEYRASPGFRYHLKIANDKAFSGPGGSEGEIPPPDTSGGRTQRAYGHEAAAFEPSTSPQRSRSPRVRDYVPTNRTMMSPVGNYVVRGSGGPTVNEGQFQHSFGQPKYPQATSGDYFGTPTSRAANAHMRRAERYQS